MGGAAYRRPPPALRDGCFDRCGVSGLDSRGPGRQPRIRIEQRANLASTARFSQAADEKIAPKCSLFSIWTENLHMCRAS